MRVWPITLEPAKIVPPLLITLALVAPGARPRVRSPVVPKNQLLAPLFTVMPSANSRSLRMNVEPLILKLEPIVMPLSVPVPDDASAGVASVLISLPPASVPLS